jgi:alpha-mannosidase
MTQITAHIISHTHWDREWYMPYEKHHYRLVELMNTLFDRLAHDPEYISFHLDGQTIMLEDYLQVRPDQKAKAVEFIRAGRLHLGPWYILQDEFLTSSEANLRNLQLGHEQALEYGTICKAGYFPDSFGNMGQAPQILKQAHMGCAFFARGVRATGKDQLHQPLQPYMSHFSEMVWESPDGSQVIGVFFPNWYSNAMEIPTDPEIAKIFWAQKLADVAKYAATHEWLFMNGCDHQPIQQDLSQALRVAKQLHPEIEFVHSNFNFYIERLTASVPAELAIIQGELRNQRTHGLDTLVNTASSRIYLKQWNQQCQTALEQLAEPLAALLHHYEPSYPHEHLQYAWKTLMQNHPHDSICGCSVDEVHREMATRFEKSYHYTLSIIETSKRRLAELIDTTCFHAYAGRVVPFVIFNTSGETRSAVVTVELELERRVLGYDRRQALLDELKQLSIGRGEIVDASGNVIAAKIEDLGIHNRLELPDDAFRIPYFARVIRVTFPVEAMAGLSVQTYAWVEQSSAIAPIPQEVAPTDEPSMENDYFKITFNANGTLNLTDKTANKTYRDALYFEDIGDLGNGYMFCQPSGEKAWTTMNTQAEILCMEREPYRTIYEIRHLWQIPISADEQLLAEQMHIVPIWERKSQRVKETILMPITTQVILEKHSRVVQFRTKITNHARDHRVRVCFPTDIDSDVHYADSIFEIPKRQNITHPVWENPSHCQHQQAFVNVRNEACGLTIANQGLPEYEILRDGRNTIAVTLLRAVGELGDFAYFPTPEGQCQGDFTLEYAFIPHGGSPEEAERSFNLAYQYRIPMITQQTKLHAGKIAPVQPFLHWSGEHLALSAVKMEKMNNGFVYRWFNMSSSPTVLQINPNRHEATWPWYRSNVLEEQLERLVQNDQGQLMLTVRPAEIITLMQIMTDQGSNTH